MPDLVTYEVAYDKRGDVAVLTIDNPPVNVLGPGVPEGILAGLERAGADDAVAALVLIGAGRSFIAGADIKTFGLPRDRAPDVRGLVEGVAASSKPVVAAIGGAALGGGLELALACHYRVASPDARLGTPEVKLGLLPGAGGTQRLPRLVGAEAALDMIITGSPIGADRGLELGLIDELVGGDLLAGALLFARRVVGEGRPLRRASELEVSTARPAEEVLARARREAAKRARGMIAPLKCIDAVEAALTLPFAEGLKRERELFMELMASEQSRALRHVFFAERQAAKVPGLAPDAKPKEIRLAAVIGAGTMGGGIAMTFANAGIPVKVMETSQDTLDRGLGVIKGNYRSSVSKGRLSAERAAERMGLIEGVLGYQATSEADIVVEAVFEDLDLKGQVFRALDGVLKPGAILATNTSTLDVDAIAAVTSRPEAVVGTHFFSPANVMKLLEIVRAAKTSDETLQTATLLAKTLGKVPVVVGVCDGFVGNRMVHKYLREAFFLIEDGALPQQVDRVMTGFGLAMGPFAMSDLAGLDVGYRIRQAQAAKRPAHQRYSSVADKLVEQGRLGQKTGAGFYRYEPGNRTPLPDPEVERLILEHSRRLGIRRRDFSDEEILKHLMYALVNEGAKILAEGVARRAGDIDVIYVYGYGFPAHRGGPMFYASRTGLDEVYANINRFHQEYGDIWKPAPLLAALAQEGKTFTDYDDERR